MVTKATIKLVRYGNTVFYKVLSQEGVGGSWVWENSENSLAIQIASCVCPDISFSYIYLRGTNTDDDDKVFSCKMSDSEYETLVRAVREAAPFITIEETVFRNGDVVKDINGKTQILIGKGNAPYGLEGNRIDLTSCKKLNKPVESEFPVCEVLTVLNGKLVWKKCVAKPNRAGIAN